MAINKALSYLILSYEKLSPFNTTISIILPSNDMWRRCRQIRATFITVLTIVINTQELLPKRAALRRSCAKWQHNFLSISPNRTECWSRMKLKEALNLTQTWRISSISVEILQVCVTSLFSHIFFYCNYDHYYNY